MRLPFLRSKSPPAAGRRRAPSGVVDPGSPAADAARQRARRRLAGALVLLLAGVVGFPLLFETQPRPLPVDTAIEMPRREGGGTVAPAASPSPSPVVRPAAEAPAVLAVETEAEAASGPPSATGAASAAAVAPPPGAGPSPRPAPAASALVAASTPAAALPVPPGAALPLRTDDGQRASALLDGTAAPAPAAAASAPRYVVQVGAYSDPAALREARAKVEKLGLKTYTQVIETAGRRSTRVRVGPYASKDEADAAAVRVKRAGLQVNIVTL